MTESSPPTKAFKATAVAPKSPRRAPPKPAAKPASKPVAAQAPAPAAPARKPETGGPKGPEPTRYGDWEKGGRCVDF